MDLLTILEKTTSSGKLQNVYFLDAGASCEISI